MLRYLRNTSIEKTIKSNLYFLLISDKIIELFKFLLPYERDWIFFRSYKIPKKSSIIDIGAHWGESAITFRKFYPKNKIYSFEPNSYAFKRLKKNTKKLDIELFNFGISKNGVKGMYFPYYNNNQLSLWGSQNLKNLKERINQYTYINCKTIKFKKIKCYFRSLPKIDEKISIIKIDVEGEEYNVIKIIKNILIKNKPLIFIEYNSNNFKKIFSFLIKKKYTAYYFKDNKLVLIKKINNLNNVIKLRKKRTINIIFN